MFGALKRASEVNGRNKLKRFYSEKNDAKWFLLMIWDLRRTIVFRRDTKQRTRREILKRALVNKSEDRFGDLGRLSQIIRVAALIIYGRGFQN